MSRYRALLAGVAVALTLIAGTAHAGIADSPLPVLTKGKKTFHLYSIPGILDFEVATFFSCTSTDNKLMKVAVEIFENTGVLQNDAAATALTLVPGGTVLIGTQGAAGLVLDTVVSGVFGKGSARILATSKHLLCTAFAADISTNPPVTAFQLTVIEKTKQKAAN